MLKSSFLFKDTLEYNYFVQNLKTLPEKETISSGLENKILEIFGITQKRIHSFTLAINSANLDGLTGQLKEKILKLGQTCITGRIFRKKISNKESRNFPATQKAVKAYLTASSKEQFLYDLKRVSIPDRSSATLLEIFSALSPCINGVYSIEEAYKIEYSKEVKKLEVIAEEDTEMDHFIVQNEKLVEYEICRNKTLARKPLLIRSNAATGSELIDRLKAYPDNPRIISAVNLFLYPYLKGMKIRHEEILEDALKNQFSSFFDDANLRNQLMSTAVDAYLRRGVVWFYETRGWEDFEIYTQISNSVIRNVSLNSMEIPAIGNNSSESTEEDNQLDLEYNWFIKWLGEENLQNVSYSPAFISLVYAIQPYLSLDLPSHDFTPTEIVGKIIKKKQVVHTERRKTKKVLKFSQKVERQAPKKRHEDPIQQKITAIVYKSWNIKNSIYIDSDINYIDADQDLYLWFDTFNGESKSRVTLSRPFTPDFLLLLKKIIEKMSHGLPKSLSCAALIQYVLVAIKEVKKESQPLKLDFLEAESNNSYLARIYQRRLENK